MLHLSKRAEAAPSVDFDHVYSQFKNPLCHYLKQFVKDAALAEELVQETFIKFFRNQHTFDASRSLNGWLKSIARNVFIDWKRSADPSASEGEVVEAVKCDRPTPEALSMLRSARKRNRQLFRKLTHSQRRVLWLRLVRQLSYAEIATTMNMSMAAVKSTIHRTRLALEGMQGELAFAV